MRLLIPLVAALVLAIPTMYGPDPCFKGYKWCQPPPCEYKWCP
jgi:hypothetical protein